MFQPENHVVCIFQPENEVVHMFQPKNQVVYVFQPGQSNGLHVSTKEWSGLHVSNRESSGLHIPVRESNCLHGSTRIIAAAFCHLPKRCVLVTVDNCWWDAAFFKTFTKQRQPTERITCRGYHNQPIKAGLAWLARHEWDIQLTNLASCVWCCLRIMATIEFSSA